MDKESGTPLTDDQDAATTTSAGRSSFWAGLNTFVPEPEPEPGPEAPEEATVAPTERRGAS